MSQRCPSCECIPEFDGAEMVCACIEMPATSPVSVVTDLADDIDLECPF